MAVAVSEVKKRLDLLGVLAVGALRDQGEGAAPRRPGEEGVHRGLAEREGVALPAQLGEEEEGEGKREGERLIVSGELAEKKQDDQIRFPQFASTVFRENRHPLALVFQERQK